MAEEFGGEDGQQRRGDAHELVEAPGFHQLFGFVDSALVLPVEECLVLLDHRPVQLLRFDAARALALEVDGELAE